MKSTELRNALHAGNRVFGTLVVSESPLWPRAIAKAGLDFVFIDTEHIALTLSQVAGMCAGFRGYGLPSIVRIPSADATAAAKMMDIGASGIIAPYIETREQARELVGAVRYRPLKGARLRDKLNGATLEPELESYLEDRNRASLLVLNIESVPGVEALDQILSEPGIDAVLIGPHDLSCSLGIPEDYENPRFLNACEQIFASARRHGVGAGIHSMGQVEQQVRFLNLGANMLIHSADLVLTTQCLQRDLRQIRQAFGEQTEELGGEVDAI